MQAAFIAVSIIIGLAVMALDVFCSFSRLPIWTSYVNAVLHPLLAISLFLAGAELIAVALALVSSAALLAFSSYTVHKRKRGERSEDDL